MKRAGTYTDLTGNTRDYSLADHLSISQKLNFATEVSGMVVSDELGYMPIIEDIIFNYYLVTYYTDISIFDSEDDFSLDALEDFFERNIQILHSILEAMGSKEYGTVKMACDNAIEFKKQNYSGLHGEISELLQAVRELVIKPDRLDMLMDSLTNAVNSFADRKDIDMATVNKLVELIPVMKEMGSKEAAKALVEDAHKNNKPKSVKGKKPKGGNIEVVK